MSEHSVCICVEGVCRANGYSSTRKKLWSELKSVSRRWRNEMRNAKKE